MNERPTPETDAAWSCFKGYTELLQDVKDLSRKLERERDEALEAKAAIKHYLTKERDEARGERDALRDAVNALHDYVHGKRNDDKDISEILNGAMKI